MEKKNPNSYFLKTSLNSSLNLLLLELETYDHVIEAYARELEKAQPLFSGRVLVRFSKRDKIKIEDDYYYDIVPDVGKMIKKSDGSWAFVWIQSADLNNLERYRVGRGMGCDRAVVKILRGLGELISKRNTLLSGIKDFRMFISRQTQSLSFLQERKMNDLIAISSDINVDWSTNAPALYKKYLEEKKTKVDFA